MNKSIKMEKVNYIIQLNEIFKRFNDDPKVKQGHISLYIAFFQKWNREFFRRKISINSKEIRKWAKIKSKTTYHGHLKDLVKWGYLKYYPSSTPKNPSQVEMIILHPKIDTSNGTSSVQKLDSTQPLGVQKMMPSIKQKNKNIYKQAEPIFQKSIIDFFEQNNWPEIEARKFYIYLKSKKWKMDNWQMIAQIYAKNDFNLKEPEMRSSFFDYVQKLERKHKWDD